MDKRWEAPLRFHFGCYYFHPVLSPTSTSDSQKRPFGDGRKNMRDRRVRRRGLQPLYFPNLKTLCLYQVWHPSATGLNPGCACFNHKSLGSYRNTVKPMIIFDGLLRPLSIFFVLKNIYWDRNFRAGGLVCAFLSSKSCFVKTCVAYLAPEEKELAPQTRHPAV